MYVQSFHPDSLDVRDCAEDETIFSGLNQAMEKIFTQFMDALKDLTRVKSAYADFLGNYP